MCVDANELDTVNLPDYLVENEKCEIWDTPYIIFLVLNHPDKVYTYFEN